MEYTAPVLPVTVPAGNGYANGLEGKDAVLIHQASTASGDWHNAFATMENSKQNVIEVMESRFQLERSIKDMDRRAERIERENQTVLKSMQIDLKNEAEKTRALILDEARRSESVALADAKAQVLFLKSFYKTPV